MKCSVLRVELLSKSIIVFGKGRKYVKVNFQQIGYGSLYKRLIEREVTSAAGTTIYKPVPSMRESRSPNRKPYWSPIRALVNHWLRLHLVKLRISSIVDSWRHKGWWVCFTKRHVGLPQSCPDHHIKPWFNIRRTTPYSNHVAKYWLWCILVILRLVEC